MSTTAPDQSSPPVSDQTQDTAGTPSDSSGDSSTRKTSTHDVSAAAPTGSSTPSGSQDSTAVTAAPVPPDAGGPADQMWVEQWDSFKTGGFGGPGPEHPAAAQLIARGRFLLLGTGGRRAQIEGAARQNGQRPKVSALGTALGALPGLPGRVLGSFFDLFAGGGGGATLLSFGLLCVLGAMLLLGFPSCARSFRLPAVTWRPSVYVPPLEHPG
jgi:hypothetical protein